MDEIWLMTVRMPRWGTDDEWRQIRKRHRAPPPLYEIILATQIMSEYLLYTAPVLAGTQANWALLATLSIQVYTFYIRFPNDRHWIKILVCIVFLLKLAQTGTSSYYAYWVLAFGWGNTTILEILPWSCLATPVFIGITAALVQIFFSWRIYVLMGKTLWACVVTSVIVLVCLLLALAQGVTIFIVMAQVARAMTLTSVTKITVGVKVWLILVAVCDILITATLIIIFSQYRVQMPWEERRSGTDTFMVKLMLNTAETGAATSATALIYLALFLVYPQHNPDQTTYANVLVFTLNARVGGAPQRLWTNHKAEAQHAVHSSTSIYPTHATHTASDYIDSH
ncbi:hypothetical protein DFH08DRAFT_950747 [Mycena albidolilacea]|uniref:DUF6534 domain-containing protein n=1 Tax=Mycena albidolilacea TaxID=1033008 RepID=A0AAD7ALQ7_9AGAR|nr:hypothetical protein DFH08DRAFT_950747 [Mycena albidolilacea]